jgi:group I intron endonuclease
MRKISGVVYCYTSPSGKKYIGQTTRENRRKCDHRLAASNSPFHNAVRKYGFEQMKYNVLYDHIETIDRLNELEELAIKEHGSLVPNGYNLDSGGKNRFKHEETKDKIRQKAYGRKISEETRRKLRESHLGKRNSPEAIEKQRQALLGLDRGQEFRDKMKEIRNRPEMIEQVKKAQTGRKRTGQALENIRKGHVKQKVRCVTTGEVFNSIKEAAEAKGLCTLSVSNGARGLVVGRKYRWEYVND